VTTNRLLPTPIDRDWWFAGSCSSLKVLTYIHVLAFVCVITQCTHSALSDSDAVGLVSHMHMCLKKYTSPVIGNSPSKEIRWVFRAASLDIAPTPRSPHLPSPSIIRIDAHHH
jgi:hypothetical protein